MINTKDENGFSLIELSIVLMISGILFAGFMSFYGIKLKQQKLQETKENMATIQVALHDFLLQNARLPCPARADLQSDHSLYGQESTCTITMPPPAGIVTAVTENRKTISIGTVPVRSLGLADSFEKDGWGHRISYAVTTALSEDGHPASNNINIEGAINVVGAQGETILTPPALYTITSHGPTGSGAYSSAGTRVSCILETRDSENCNENGTALIAPVSDIEGPLFYDDIVVHDRNITYNKDSVLAQTLESLMHCQRKSAFYKPASASSDQDGCTQAAISTGSCASGYVMSGVDSSGKIICNPKMESGHCKNGEMLLGYDEYGNRLCDNTVLKMLACSQQGLLYAGEGSSGADSAGCKPSAPSP